MRNRLQAHSPGTAPNATEASSFVPIPGPVHPRNAPSPEVPDADPVPPAHYLAYALQRIETHLGRMARGIDNRMRPVDEYQSGSLAVTSETVIMVQPIFDTGIAERIESIIITGPPSGETGSFAGSGSVTAPGAAQQIANAGLLLPGLYDISWNVSVSGTLAAAENDNFNLKLGATTLLGSDNPAVAGEYPQASYRLLVPPGNASQLKVLSGGAGTAGAVYDASVSAAPVLNTVQLQLGDRVFPALTIPPSGVLVIAPVSILLAYSDVRQLTAQIPGEYFLELMGWADERY